MDKDPMYFGSKYVEFCATWDDSRRLNYLTGPDGHHRLVGHVRGRAGSATTCGTSSTTPTTRS